METTKNKCGPSFLGRYFNNGCAWTQKKNQLYHSINYLDTLFSLKVKKQAAPSNQLSPQPSYSSRYTASESILLRQFSPKKTEEISQLLTLKKRPKAVSPSHRNNACQQQRTNKKPLLCTNCKHHLYNGKVKQQRNYQQQFYPQSSIGSSKFKKTKHGLDYDSQLNEMQLHELLKTQRSNVPSVSIKIQNLEEEVSKFPQKVKSKSFRAYNDTYKKERSLEPVLKNEQKYQKNNKLMNQILLLQNLFLSSQRQDLRQKSLMHQLAQKKEQSQQQPKKVIRKQGKQDEQRQFEFSDINKQLLQIEAFVKNKGSRVQRDRLNKVKNYPDTSEKQSAIYNKYLQHKHSKKEDLQPTDNQNNSTDFRKKVGQKLIKSFGNQQQLYGGNERKQKSKSILVEQIQQLLSLSNSSKQNQKSSPTIEEPKQKKKFKQYAQQISISLGPTPKASRKMTFSKQIYQVIQVRQNIKLNNIIQQRGGQLNTEKASKQHVQPQKAKQVERKVPQPAVPKVNSSIKANALKLLQQLQQAAKNFQTIQPNDNGQIDKSKKSLQVIIEASSDLSQSKVQNETPKSTQLQGLHLSPFKIGQTNQSKANITQPIIKDRNKQPILNNAKVKAQDIAKSPSQRSISQSNFDVASRQILEQGSINLTDNSKSFTRKQGLNQEKKKLLLKRRQQRQKKALQLQESRKTRTDKRLRYHQKTQNTNSATVRIEDVAMIVSKTIQKEDLPLKDADATLKQEQPKTQSKNIKKDMYLQRDQHIESQRGSFKKNKDQASLNYTQQAEDQLSLFGQSKISEDSERKNEKGSRQRSRRNAQRPSAGSKLQEIRRRKELLNSNKQTGSYLQPKKIHGFTQKEQFQPKEVKLSSLQLQDKPIQRPQLQLQLSRSRSIQLSILEESQSYSKALQIERSSTNTGDYNFVQKLINVFYEQTPQRIKMLRRLAIQSISTAPYNQHPKFNQLLYNIQKQVDCSQLARQVLQQNPGCLSFFLRVMALNNQMPESSLVSWLFQTAKLQMSKMSSGKDQEWHKALQNKIDMLQSFSKQKTKKRSSRRRISSLVRKIRLSNLTIKKSKTFDWKSLGVTNKEYSEYLAGIQDSVCYLDRGFPPIDNSAGYQNSFWRRAGQLYPGFRLQSQNCKMSFKSGGGSAFAKFLQYLLSTSQGVTIFQDSVQHGDGLISLDILGIKIEVDDFLLTDSARQFPYIQPAGTDCWPLFVQKAFAKILGSYVELYSHSNVSFLSMIPFPRLTQLDFSKPQMSQCNLLLIGNNNGIQQAQWQSSTQNYLIRSSGQKLDIKSICQRYQLGFSHIARRNQSIRLVGPKFKGQSVYQLTAEESGRAVIRVSSQSGCQCQVMLFSNSRAQMFQPKLSFIVNTGSQISKSVLVQLGVSYCLIINSSQESELTVSTSGLHLSPSSSSRPPTSSDIFRSLLNKFAPDMHAISQKLKVRRLICYDMGLWMQQLENTHNEPIQFWKSFEMASQNVLLLSPAPEDLQRPCQAGQRVVIACGGSRKELEEVGRKVDLIRKFASKVDFGAYLQPSPYFLQLQ